MSIRIFDTIKNKGEPLGHSDIDSNSKYDEPWYEDEPWYKMKDWEKEQTDPDVLAARKAIDEQFLPEVIKRKQEKEKAMKLFGLRQKAAYEKYYGKNPDAASLENPSITNRQQEILPKYRKERKI